MNKMYTMMHKTFNSCRMFILSMVYWIRASIKKEYISFHDNDFKDNILIMGNGPSLKALDYSKLSREKMKICCVNNFPIMNDYFTKLKPEFLCLIDPGYYDFTTKVESETKAKLFEILESVDWNITIIAPKGKKLQVSNSKLSYAWINTNKLKDDVWNFEKWWLLNNNLATTGLQNVVLGAMYYFLSSNYKKIYITGVDFSDFKNLFVDKNNRIYVDSAHSYGSQRLYFDEMPEYGFTKFYTILGAYHMMFVEANNVRKYADYKKIDIINLSQDSYVDSFLKADLDELYNMK